MADGAQSEKWHILGIFLFLFVARFRAVTKSASVHDVVDWTKVMTDVTRLQWLQSQQPKGVYMISITSK